MKIVNKETPRTYFKGQYFCHTYKHFTLTSKPFFVTHSIPVFQRDRDGVRYANSKVKGHNVSFKWISEIKETFFKIDLQIFFN